MLISSRNFALMEVKDDQLGAADLLSPLHDLLGIDIASNEASQDMQLLKAVTVKVARYDVHVTSGGLGLTHSMQFFPSLAFKARVSSHVIVPMAKSYMSQGYLAVPFVEEMRVLTDWTVTRQVIQHTYSCWCYHACFGGPQWIFSCG